LVWDVSVARGVEKGEGEGEEERGTYMAKSSWWPDASRTTKDEGAEVEV
jgi:hypothetical protein